jgi:type VI protein secretion system component Hcp
MKSSLIARIAAGLSVLAVTAIAAPAFADVYYLKIPPGQIEGSEPKGDISQKPADMYKITSFSIGVGKPENIGSASSGAGAGKATMESMTVTGADSDAASTLTQDAIQDKHLPELVLVIGKNVSGKVVPYQLFIMKNVYITSSELSANSKGKLLDTFDINYQQISYEQSTVDTTKPLGASTLTTMGWNRVLNRPAP